MTDRDIYEKLAKWIDQNLPVCLAIIIETQGSTPRQVGAKMLIFADGTTYGSIGGGCGENIVRSAAFRCLLKEGKGEIVEADLTDDLGTRNGDVCGGRMWVYVEPYAKIVSPE